MPTKSPPFTNDTPSTVDIASSLQHASDGSDDEMPALMIAWSADEPHRIGEVALFEAEGAAMVLGRGASPMGGGERVTFLRQRPGTLDRTPPLSGPGISREQLRIRAEGHRLHVARTGRCSMLVAGEAVDRCVLAPGDTLLLKNQLLLFSTTRPRRLPPLRDFPARAGGAFGDPDALHISGESPVTWRLRDRIAWCAKAGQHVLVLGESGTGKELVARALHALSSRARGPFVARSAATIPSGLADAELFGSVKGYPNPGMPERPGLVGAADGGTLFLDEIGELPRALQANLLRVLDSDGEHHRLGGSTVTSSSFRFVGATNREPESLKHDLCARLTLQISLPNLEQRRDDIPLLVRDLLRRASLKSPDVTRRFAEQPGGPPRVKASLIDHLLKRRYSTNVRELDAILWEAMSASPGSAVAWPADAGSTEPSDPPPAPPRGAAKKAAAPVVEPSADEIRARLSEHGGNVARVARALGLSSRYALYRLLRKHEIDVDESRPGEDG